MFSTKVAVVISSISASIITVFCVVALNEMWVDFNNSMMMGCIPSEFNINEDIKAMLLMGAISCYFISSLFLGILYLIKPHNNKLNEAMGK